MIQIFRSTLTEEKITSFVMCMGECHGPSSTTITTRFISLSNGRFGHPDENRAISIREGATLQTFPKSYEFHSSNLNALARQIGNAVPPELAKRIGEHLRSVRHG